MVVLPARQASPLTGYLLTLILALICGSAMAADFSAAVDRDKLALGESLTLTLRYAGQVLGEPDFSGLEQHFEVLSSQRQSHLSIGSGADSSSTEWRLTLLPRDTGTLVIPSFRFRNQVSDAIPIEVSDSSGAADTSQPFFVETEIDTSRPRIQEQVLVTYKIHSAQPLLSLSAAELEVPDARVVPVHEVQYQRTLDGQNYGVVEVRYAVFPDRAGQLEIPALRFRGEVSATDGHYRSFGLSAFNRGRKPVVMSSASQVLEVLPRPDTIPADRWLPSKGLSLAQRWSRELDELVVGEPVTRSVIISAQGLQGAQLPSLEMDPGDDFRIYPDQPRIEDSTSASGVIGTRIESVAIMPTRPGPLEIPAIRLTWWDTVSGVERETYLDAITVQVSAAPGRASDPATDALATTPASALAVSDGQPSWLWLSALANLVLGLLVVVFALLWWRQRSPSTADGSLFIPGDKNIHDEQAAFERIRQCPPDQLADLRHRILQWARLHWQGRQLKTLDDVAMLSGDARLGSLFVQLDTSLYGQGDSGTQFDATGQSAILACLAALRSEKPDPGSKQPHLPPLYPQD